MARNKNGTNLNHEELKDAVWFDIEKREKDVEPALTGMMVDDEFSITVHDERLSIGAEYSNLHLKNGKPFFEALIEKCRNEGRMLISYTKADYEFITSAYPDLKDDLDQIYQKTRFTSWFRQNKPRLFELMQKKKASKTRKKRVRNRPMRKKSGEFQIGLKDMLQLDEVDYPNRSKVGIGGSANAIKKIRTRYNKTGDNENSITAGEKKAWTKMLTYLKHDVLGLAHLTKWVNSENNS